MSKGLEFRRAAALGDLDKLIALRPEITDINEAGQQYQKTALHAAAAAAAAQKETNPQELIKYEKVIKWLIIQGCDPQLKDTNKKSPINYQPWIAQFVIEQEKIKKSAQASIEFSQKRFPILAVNNNSLSQQRYHLNMTAQATLTQKGSALADQDVASTLLGIYITSNLVNNTKAYQLAACGERSYASYYNLIMNEKFDANVFNIQLYDARTGAGHQFNLIGGNKDGIEALRKNPALIATDLYKLLGDAIVCDAYTSGTGIYYISNLPEDSFLVDVRNQYTRNIAPSYTVNVEFHSMGINYARAHQNDARVRAILEALKECAPKQLDSTPSSSPSSTASMKIKNKK